MHAPRLSAPVTRGKQLGLALLVVCATAAGLLISALSSAPPARDHYQFSAASAAFDPLRPRPKQARVATPAQPGQNGPATPAD